MKETVFDVLMYLFENYMDEGPEFHPDQKQLALELSEAGFHRGEIRKAFRWLDGLSAQRRSSGGQSLHRDPAAMRHYDPGELRKLGPACRGFLLLMEQHGALDACTRELVIERAMALDLEEIALEQLKWIVLMVLNRQPGHEYAHALVEDMVYDDLQGQGQLH
jgi:Smg protein